MAFGHGEVGDVLPMEPGLRVSAQAALRAVDSPGTLPSARMDGVLIRGDAGPDPVGLRLEHATVAAAWRINPQWGVHAAAGAHDQDPAHVEAAWIQWRRDGEAGQAWLLTAGRQRMSLGPVLGDEGHIGPYGLVPLAQRAAFDHALADDGMQFGWRAPTGAADLALDLGIWRGQRFPGAEHGGSRSPGISLHAGASWQAWSADVAWLRVQPKARGASTSPAAGHSHGSPVCDPLFTEVACFGGRAQVMGGSLRWTGAESASRLPLNLTMGGWRRHERGVLESGNGQADYRGLTAGSWFDADWLWHARWSLGWRHERLSVRHRLNGSGAGLLAQESRLQHAGPWRRDTLQLTWQARAWARLSLAGGEETATGQRTRFTVLRLVLGGDWNGLPGTLGKDGA